MEYLSNKKEIILNRELNKLDRFALDFVKVLSKHTEYVIVSGYVSILLGRSRATDDIDLLVPVLDFNKFKQIWNDMYNNEFECINTSKFDEAFSMLKQHAIRFQKKIAVPNIEFKLAKNDMDNYALNNRIKVVIGNEALFISPLELQIAYKLFLSSEKADKDIEDARHLYKIFGDKNDIFSTLKGGVSMMTFLV